VCLEVGGGVFKVEGDGRARLRWCCLIFVQRQECSEINMKFDAVALILGAVSSVGAGVVIPRDDTRECSVGVCLWDVS
jgi:hypothetical protein